MGKDESIPVFWLLMNQDRTIVNYNVDLKDSGIIPFLGIFKDKNNAESALEQIQRLDPSATFRIMPSVIEMVDEELVLENL